MKLAGTKALVTGCSTGIGRATATELARRGVEVWGTTRRQAPVQFTESEAIHVVRVDLTSSAAVADLIDRTGAVDILINNAGYGLEGAIEEVSDEELRRQYEVNVFAPWRLCRAVLPGMRARRRGAIVNISSFGAHVPFPGIGAYRSSKFALEGMTWTLHLEVGHFGVRVIAIEPGLVESAFSSNSVMAGRARGSAGPYAEMRQEIRIAYPRMSPAALTPDVVASRVADELAADEGPLHIQIGEDSTRMIAKAQGGEHEYHRYLAKDLGFTWLPLERIDGSDA